MIALLLLIQAAPETSYMPIEATIAEVRADPQKFDGKLVRLRGWINRCQRLSCLIDEKESQSPDEAGARLSIAADKLFDDLVVPRQPVRVVIDAAFSAQCFKDEICVDRAANLTIVRAALDPDGDAVPTKD